MHPDDLIRLRHILDAAHQAGEFVRFEVLVCRVIGSYYIYETLEGIARRSRVVLVE